MGMMIPIQRKSLNVLMCICSPFSVSRIQTPAFIVIAVTCINVSPMTIDKRLLKSKFDKSTSDAAGDKGWSRAMVTSDYKVQSSRLLSLRTG